MAYTLIPFAKALKISLAQQFSKFGMDLREQARINVLLLIVFSTKAQYIFDI